MLILIHNRSRAGLASREVGDARERAGRDRSLEARTAHAPTRACCMLTMYSQQSTQEHNASDRILIINLSFLFSILHACTLLELINHDTSSAYIRACLRHHAMQGLYLSLRVSLRSSLNPPQ